MASTYMNALAQVEEQWWSRFIGAKHGALSILEKHGLSTTHVLRWTLRRRAGSGRGSKEFSLSKCMEEIGEDGYRFRYKTLDVYIHFGGIESGPWPQPYPIGYEQRRILEERYGSLGDTLVVLEISPTDMDAIDDEAELLRELGFSRAAGSLKKSELILTAPRLFIPLFWTGVYAVVTDTGAILEHGVMAASQFDKMLEKLFEHYRRYATNIFERAAIETKQTIEAIREALKSPPPSGAKLASLLRELAGDIETLDVKIDMFGVEYNAPTRLNPYHHLKMDAVKFNYNNRTYAAYLVTEIDQPGQARLTITISEDKKTPPLLSAENVGKEIAALLDTTNNLGILPPFREELRLNIDMHNYTITVTLDWRDPSTGILKSKTYKFSANTNTAEYQALEKAVQKLLTTTAYYTKKNADAVSSIGRHYRPTTRSEQPQYWLVEELYVLPGQKDAVEELLVRLAETGHVRVVEDNIFIDNYAFSRLSKYAIIRVANAENPYTSRSVRQAS